MHGVGRLANQPRSHLPPHALPLSPIKSGHSQAIAVLYTNSSLVAFRGASLRPSVLDMAKDRASAIAVGPSGRSVLVGTESGFLRVFRPTPTINGESTITNTATAADDVAALASVLASSSLGGMEGWYEDA